MKRKMAGRPGYIFCEISFFLFNKFDVPYVDERWKWYHKITYSLGETAYSIGCFFYNIQLED